MPKKRKSKVASAGDTPLTPITAKERRNIDERIKKKYDRFRRRYPEIHGKVVDFITHSIEDGTLYLSVRFTDKTDFSLRYACDMLVVGADFCDFKTGATPLWTAFSRPNVGGVAPGLSPQNSDRVLPACMQKCIRT